MLGSVVANAKRAMSADACRLIRTRIRTDSQLASTVRVPAASPASLQAPVAQEPCGVSADWSFMVNTNSPGHQAGPGQGSRRGVAGGLGLAVPCRFLTTTTTSGAACAAMLRDFTRSCAVRGLCVPSNAQVALVAIAIATRTSWNKASHKLKHTPGKSQPTPGKSHRQVGLSTCHSLHGSGDSWPAVF